MKQSAGKRIVILLPNWVGDVVMATPTLRAIREHFPDSFIGLVLRPTGAEVLEGSGWADEMFIKPVGKEKKSVGDFLTLSHSLRRARFDTAILLTNSFRAALLAKLAKIRRRIGYDRDGRMLLLTDYLIPAKKKGKFLPVSMRDYYLAIAKYVGCEIGNIDPELVATESDNRSLDGLLAQLGVEAGKPIVVLCPGAAFGPTKCWAPERFAAVADRLTADFDAQPVISCGPREFEIGQRVSQSAARRVFLPTPEQLPLGTLKALVARSGLVVTNDTGPRHFAISFGVPVVTIFGPTDPAWTETNYPLERKILVPVDCGPCMKRRCTEDHRCMTDITSDTVARAAAELLTARIAESETAV